MVGTAFRHRRGCIGTRGSGWFYLSRLIFTCNPTPTYRQASRSFSPVSPEWEFNFHSGVSIQILRSRELALGYLRETWRQ